MSCSTSFICDISDPDLHVIMANANRRPFHKDELVFSQGDPGDAFYYIESGSVNVFFNDNGKRVALRKLGKGEYFGEMALIHHDLRSASVEAAEDSTLLWVDCDRFLSLLQQQPELAARIQQILAPRNEELILREQLIDTTSTHNRKLHISIKGDPSLRETALFRERYESPIDKIFDQLEGALKTLLLERCIYHINIHFNSGEIHTRSVFDPYRDEIHIGERLINTAYLDRHFHKIAYEEKLALIRSVYDAITLAPQFKTLPEEWKSIHRKSSANWQPIAKQDIVSILSKLAKMRLEPNFYLRNFGVSITQDAIRMQFNCDGTHIVSSDDYLHFLQLNFL